MSLIEKAIAQKANSQPDPAAEPRDTIEPQSQLQNEQQAPEQRQFEEDVTTSGDNYQSSDNSRLELDFTQLMEKGFLSPDTQLQNRHQEEYRFIKRKLLHNAFAAGGKLVPRGNLILVTSCHPKEGKTFNAINLALSIALERDKTVLLIDGDVIKASLNHSLGFPREQAGLLDYLDGSVHELSDVIYQTNLPNLRLIPAGSPHALSNELLASEKMQLLMEDLVRRYPDRVIILDSPPLLGVSDTHVLTHYAGQAVFVVSYGKTTQRDIQQGLSQLPEDIAVGFVMNRSKGEHGEPYDYYYGMRESAEAETST